MIQPRSLVLLVAGGSVALGLLLLTVVLSLPTASASTSSLKNGGFESGASDWLKSRPNLAFETVTSTVHSGDQAAELSVEPGLEGFVYQNLQLMPGGQYTLSGWVKAGGPIAAAGLRVVWADDTSIPAAWQPLQSAADSYTLLTVPFQVPTSTTTTRVELYAGFTREQSSNPIYFDDLSLTLDATPTPSPSPPPIFTPTTVPTPTETVSPTATPTATPIPTDTRRVALNEVLPAPRSKDWDADGQPGPNDEWIEIYNLENDSVDLSGWRLSDAAHPNAGYHLPSGLTIASGGFLVFYKRETRLALANDGDTIYLFRSDSSLADDFQYKTGRPDQSFSRSIDGLGPWVPDYPPSPGQPNRPAPPPTPQPAKPIDPTLVVVYADTVFLNEVLAAPHGLDWNGDGKVDAQDEWIELYNLGDQPADLGGWQLDDLAAQQRRRPFVIAAGRVIAPHSFLVLTHQETGLALNNDGDTLRLLRPDGELADQIDYPATPYDRSFARYPDGSGEWRESSSPTPGSPNLPPATPTPSPTIVPAATSTPPPPAVVTETATIIPVGEARGRPSGEKVTVRGRLSAPPGVLGESVAYLQDETGGIRLSLPKTVDPSLAEGQELEVRGQLATYHGEITLRVTKPENVKATGSVERLSPRPALIEGLNSSNEGLLVQITGTVTRLDQDDIYLSDDTAEGPAHFLAASGVPRPDVGRGDVVSVAGIVSQYDGKYRLLPRYQSDAAILSQAVKSTPSRKILPRTGEARTWVFGLSAVLLLTSGGVLRTLSGRSRWPG